RSTVSSATPVALNRSAVPVAAAAAMKASGIDSRRARIAASNRTEAPNGAASMARTERKVWAMLHVYGRAGVCAPLLTERRLARFCSHGLSSWRPKRSPRCRTGALVGPNAYELRGSDPRPPTPRASARGSLGTNLRTRMDNVTHPALFAAAEH